MLLSLKRLLWSRRRVRHHFLDAVLSRLSQLEQLPLSTGLPMLKVLQDL
jgi:hypothetical protein